MTYLYLGYQDPQLEKLEIERNARTARLVRTLGPAADDRAPQRSRSRPPGR